MFFFQQLFLFNYVLLSLMLFLFHYIYHTIINDIQMIVPHKFPFFIASIAMTFINLLVLWHFYNWWYTQIRVVVAIAKELTFGITSPKSSTWLFGWRCSFEPSQLKYQCLGQCLVGIHYLLKVFWYIPKKDLHVNSLILL